MLGLRTSASSDQLGRQAGGIELQRRQETEQPAGAPTLLLALAALENEFYLSCGAVDKQLCSSGSGSNKAALSLPCTSPLLLQRALHRKLSESCEERREIETRFRAARAAVAMEGGFT